ncbi:DegT/DnrJ/EryC1/StrS family aminotransferase [Candidatus Zixiibacteriota bacterium]
MKVPLLDLKAQYATIKEELRAAVDEVMENCSFILGPYVQKFEEAVAEYSQTKFAIGVASGTDALLLSLRACQVGPGDEVITTPYSFFATAGVISRLGATPVFVDIDASTYNISPDLIAPKISTRTKAIMPVHLYGQCAEMDPIMALAEEHNIMVVEDAAQAIGAEYRGRKAGNIGHLGCFSFFPSKNLGGLGDGGMVATNDPQLSELVRILRVHGSKPKYYHSIVGYNSRLDALQAAALQVKLNHLDEWTETRREHARIYDERFKDLPVVTPHAETYNRHIYNQYTIRVDNRDGLQEHLKEKGVGTALYYPLPLHLQECYRDLNHRRGDFPESEKAAKETISLPVYPELTREGQEYVVEKIVEFVE